MKNYDRLYIYGQYTDYNQPSVDHRIIAANLDNSKYNYISWHLMSPWGNGASQPGMLIDPKGGHDIPYRRGRFYPWKQTPEAIFDMLTQNDAWYAYYYWSHRAYFEKGIGIEDCFFDRYFMLNKTWSNATPKPHPFVKNNVGINWGMNEEPLYESWNKTGGANPPDSAFAWAKWTSNNLPGYKERVIAYKPIGKIGEALFAYIRRCGTILKELHTEFPDCPATLIRLTNENYIQFKVGEHEDRGGESKLFEITQQILENECGLKHCVGNKQTSGEFRMVDDTIQFEGRDVLWKEMARAQKVYLPMFRWFAEVHGITAEDIEQGVAAGMKSDMTIWSTDGLKPEVDPSFTAKNKQITRKGYPLVDYKVPSELSPYYPYDLTKTHLAVMPKMKQFTV